MKEWTKERLAALSARDRATMYANAKKKGTAEGEALAKLIEDAGLPFSEAGGIRMDDPLVSAMEAVIQSAECRIACIKAVEQRLPAIAGADPLLAVKFQADYGKHNMTTNVAGHLVANLMRSLGFRMVGREAATPPGCVARSGELWSK